MKKFNVGDIVSMKMLQGEEHYYMVIGETDLTKKGDKKLDVDYDIVIIYPIENNPVIETMIHDELKLEAEYKSKEYELILQDVARKREHLGLPTFPKSINHVIGEDNVNKPKKLALPPATPKKKFGMKEINAIMRDNHGEKKIEVYKEKMDTHLELLHKAIEEGNEEQIKLQKGQLEKVRQTLMELEYFPFKHNRR